MVDGGGLENRCTGNRIGGSNPSPSATFTQAPRPGQSGTRTGLRRASVPAVEAVIDRRALATAVVVALLMAVGVAPVCAQAISLQELVRETQKQGNDPGRITIAWWLPEEFWDGLPRSRVVGLVALRQKR